MYTISSCFSCYLLYCKLEKPKKNIKIIIIFFYYFVCLFCFVFDLIVVATNTNTTNNKNNKIKIFFFFFFLKFCWVLGFVSCVLVKKKKPEFIADFVYIQVRRHKQKFCCQLVEIGDPKICYYYYYSTIMQQQQKQKCV